MAASHRWYIISLVGLRLSLDVPVEHEDTQEPRDHGPEHPRRGAEQHVHQAVLTRLRSVTIRVDDLRVVVPDESAVWRPRVLEGADDDWGWDITEDVDPWSGLVGIETGAGSWN